MLTNFRNKLLVVFVMVLSIKAFSQPLPSNDEKFPFLMTFSKKASKTWGDDDCVQTIFFAIPLTNKEPIYIRVFDPDNGGKNDENRGGFDSKTKFSIYGGKGAHSNPDAKLTNPTGNYKSGILMVTKTFGVDDKTDDKWHTFGPFNPSEGELQPENGGYVFKIIVEGMDGDDGNVYKFFLSKHPENNIAVDGGNAFCYEYSVRLSDAIGSVAHVYPFLPINVIKVKINVFDFDNEGIVRSVTVAKKGDIVNSKTEGTWDSLKVAITKEELNTSMDIQFIKKNDVKNNNIVIFITNQYNEAIPFYSVPLGGIPKYKYKIEINKLK